MTSSRASWNIGARSRGPREKEVPAHEAQREGSFLHGDHRYVLGRVVTGQIHRSRLKTGSRGASQQKCRLLSPATLSSVHQDVNRGVHHGVFGFFDYCGVCSVTVDTAETDVKRVVLLVLTRT